MTQDATLMMGSLRPAIFTMPIQKNRFRQPIELLLSSYQSVKLGIKLPMSEENEREIKKRLHQEMLVEIVKIAGSFSGEDAKRVQKKKVRISDIDQPTIADIKISFLERLRKQKVVKDFEVLTETTELKLLDTKRQKPGPLEMELDREALLEYEQEQVEAANLIDLDPDYVHIAQVYFVPNKILHFYSQLVPSAIHKISFVERSYGLVKFVVVNDDYKKPIEIKLKKYWQTLYDTAKGVDVCLNEKQSKRVVDYFNSNDKNPLYAKWKYVRTRVLGLSGTSIVEGDTKLEVISEQSYARRCNKLRKPVA